MVTLCNILHFLEMVPSHAFQFFTPYALRLLCCQTNSFVEIVLTDCWVVELIAQKVAWKICLDQSLRLGIDCKNELGFP